MPINRRRLFRSVAALLLLSLTPALPAVAAEPFITVASTTSTQSSGLFDFLLPKFTEKSGVEVRVVAQGTGQALKTGQNGDADVLFVHAKPDELKFVEQGYGVDRHDVMYNDFVIVGPKSDPAGVAGSRDASAALAKIAQSQAAFASRGDDSGTNKAEMNLWKAAGVDPKGNGWYRETGSGMGATLNTASEMNAYSLTDRGTWLSFKNRGDLTIVVEGDPKLFNQYGVLLVNPAKHPHVKASEGEAFINWLVSPEGQQAIADYKIDGQQLFFPNAEVGKS